LRIAIAGSVSRVYAHLARQKKMCDAVITHLELQETITALFNLTEIPEEPQENLMKSNVCSPHRLSILQEYRIASNLAFLSATSDDVLKVMAVCIEEHRITDEITIRIASNTGNISEVIRGFEVIAKILKEAASRCKEFLPTHSSQLISP
jgi:hypothetical protein